VNYSNIYNINFRKLANLLTPPFLRKQKSIDFLEVLLTPLSIVNRSLRKFRAQAIYKVKHNGQVVYLQAVLNDFYDNYERRIYIDDFPVIESLYIYTAPENKTVFLGEMSIYSDAEVTLTVEYDFIVYVPIEYKPNTEQSLNAFLVQMRSLINYYKLASKRYNIIFY
jgi:hypothetical protein